MTTNGADQLISNPLLTMDEAAAYLSIPKGTLYTWRTRRPGFGPSAIRLGGALRYRLTDLDAWIEARAEHFDGDGTPLHQNDSRRGKPLQPRTASVTSRQSNPRRR